MAFSCPHCQKEIEGAIPKERLAQVNQERREAEARLVEVEKRLGEAEKRGATADALTKQLAEATARHDAERGGWTTERAIVAAGVSEAEGVDVIRALYERLPAGADGQRMPITDWLGKPDALPRAVRAYLPQPAPPGQAPPPPAPPPPANSGRPPPAANAGVQPPPPPAGQFSPAGIARMSAADFKAALPALLGQMGTRPPGT